MNNLLNATCWGELPTAELESPQWMSGSYYDDEVWRDNNRTAEAEAAIGRSRRKARIDRNHRRNAKLCLVGLIGTMVMLAVIGTILG